jgi:predicted GNAT family N-acyltransferase
MRRRLQQLVEALRTAQAAARQRALEAEAQRKLREAKRRYGFPMDAGRES